MIFESLATFSSKLYFFTSFVNTTQGFPQPLTKEEEKECLEKMKQGDMRARDILINHNLRLVAHIVKKFNNTMEADDLISVGTIGLIKAVDSFDPNKGALLSTYASSCIQNEILMLLRSNKKHKDTVSLSAVCKGKEGDEETTLEGVVGVVLDDEIIDTVENNFMMDKVYKAMENCLSDVERAVIKYRFGLDNQKPLAQREVAAILGLSRSYISRIETTALKKLGKTMKDEEEKY